MRIARFVACYNDTLFPETGIAVTRVLERLGHAVGFPIEQTCCGQMHYNTIYQREAVPLVRRFISIFRDVNHGLVLASQGHRDDAVAMLKHAVALAPTDPVVQNAIEQLRHYQLAGSTHARN